MTCRRVLWANSFAQSQHRFSRREINYTRQKMPQNDAGTIKVPHKSISNLKWDLNGFDRMQRLTINYNSFDWRLF